MGDSHQASCDEVSKYQDPSQVFVQEKNLDIYNEKSELFLMIQHINLLKNMSVLNNFISSDTYLLTIYSNLSFSELKMFYSYIVPIPSRKRFASPCRKLQVLYFSGEESMQEIHELFSKHKLLQVDRYTDIESFLQEREGFHTITESLDDSC